MICGSRSTRRIACTARPATSRIRPRTSNGWSPKAAAAPIIRTCSLAAALLLALPAAAQTGPGDYVRARAADAEGAAHIAAAGYARALAAVPGDEVVALRAYRQALAIGDYVLASRAAAVLARAGTAPPDAALLAVAIALRSGDRRGAEAAVARMHGDALDFLAPAISAWLAFDRGEDAVAALDAAPGSALARRYTARHRALLLIASRRTAEGMAALALELGNQATDDLRIDAALLLGQSGARDRGRMLLEGVGLEGAALRKRLGKGRAGAATGISRLFLGVAADVADEDMTSLSILLTRAALLLDPADDRARLHLAEALSHDGSHDLALSVLGEVRRDSPFARGAAAGRIAVLRRAGRTDQAFAEAKALAEGKRATSADARTYGDLLAERGAFAPAARAYAAALDLPGADAWDLHYLRGAALDRAGDWDEALPALRRAVELAPDQAQPLQYLADAQVRRGENLADAQALLERARSIDPEDAGIADSLAWTYFERGDTARAVPLLEEATRADPGSARAGEHLGDAYWRLGRRYEARYAWRAAALQAEGDAVRRLETKLAN